MIINFVLCSASKGYYKRSRRLQMCLGKNDTSSRRIFFCMPFLSYYRCFTIHRRWRSIELLSFDNHLLSQILKLFHTVCHLRVIDAYVEMLDIKTLNCKYSEPKDPGRRSYNPKHMLKLYIRIFQWYQNQSKAWKRMQQKFWTDVANQSVGTGFYD